MSGCLTGERSDAAEGQTPTELISEEGKGALQGTVHDPGLVPLEGAQVGLPELLLVTVADASGYFSFPDLPPGRYQLAAQRLGYESVARSVDVLAGETATVNLALAPIPVVEPYSVVQIQRGSFGCGFAYRPTVGGIVGASVCGALSLYLNLTSIDRFLLLWDLAGTYDEWSGTAFEMEWQSTQLLGGGLWVRFETDGCAGSLASTFTSVRGRSPLRDVYGNDLLSERKANNTDSSCGANENCAPSRCRLQSRVFPHTETLGPSAPADIGFTFQQPFTQYWSQFFSSEPPTDYAAIPDS